MCRCAFRFLFFTFSIMVHTFLNCWFNFPYRKRTISQSKSANKKNQNTERLKLQCFKQILNFMCRGDRIGTLRHLRPVIGELAHAANTHTNAAHVAIEFIYLLLLWNWLSLQMFVHLVNRWKRHKYMWQPRYVIPNWPQTCYLCIKINYYKANVNNGLMAAAVVVVVVCERTKFNRQTNNRTLQRDTINKRCVTRIWRGVNSSEFAF